MRRIVSVIMKQADIPAADSGMSAERYRLKILWKRERVQVKRNMMEKILVIGSPGAGKSTFARKLRDETGISLYYLDLLWHRPDRTNAAREEFDARLRRFLKRTGGLSTGTIFAPLRRACGHAIRCFFWIIRWKSAWQEQKNASGKSGRICRGLRRSLMRSSDSGSLISRKTSSR